MSEKPADPLRDLAQAVLDGRVTITTDYTQTKDGKTTTTHARIVVVDPDTP